MKLFAHTAILMLVVTMLATTAHASFCAPPVPTPNDLPPNPDNAPPCNPGQCENCNASPCFAKTGVYTTRTIDLQIPTNGFHLLVSRSYESSQLVDGALGYGWRSNFGARLYYATYLLTPPATFSKEAIIVMPDGESYRYRENSDGSFTPPTGRRDALTKLGDGSFRLTLQHGGAQYLFAADGALLTLKDEFGNTLSFTHDTSRRVIQVSDDSGTGGYLAVTWNPSGRISAIQDHTGRTIVYSYGTNGTLTGVTNAAGQTTTYAYQQRRFAPQLSRITDHWSRILTEITWDSVDRVASYTEGGETYSMTYVAASQFNPAHTVKTHSRGSQVISYDGNGMVTSRGAETKTYSAEGDVTSQGSALYTYTSDGRLATVSYGDDVLFQITYDANYPNKVAKVEPRVASSTSLYHGHWLGWKYTYYSPTESGTGTLPGALKQVDRMAFQHQTQTVLTDGDPVATFAQYSYDSKGRVTRSWNRTEGEVTYAYNDTTRTLSVTLPWNGVTGRVATYAFDRLGRVISVTDPLGNVTSYEYDTLDRIVRVILPKPSPTYSADFVTTFTYDNVGANPALNYTHSTDANEHVTKQGFDEFGRLIEDIDALGNTTRYAYVNGLLNSITDANGNVTAYEHDALRRLSKTTFPDGRTETYEYLSDGKLSAKTNRRGERTTYAYDEYGRAAGQTTGSVSRSYTYQGQKLTTITDSYSGASDQITYTYDPKTFLPLSEKQGVNGARGTVDYTWSSAVDRLTRYKVTDPEGLPNDTQTVDYAYFSDGSVRSISWSRGPGTYYFSYDALGRQTVIGFPNGQSRNFTYDNQGRLTRVRNAIGTTNLATFDYEYDRDNNTALLTVLGQRTKMTAVVPSITSIPTNVEYFYDSNYQLTRARTTGSSTTDRSWTYDAIGNRLTQTIGSSTTSYAYLKNAGNPLNSSRLTAAGSDSVSYDLNGNITALGSLTYTWDALDRMKSRTTAATYTFTYDVFNRRTRIDYESTKFIYRGVDPVDISYRKGTGYYRSNYLFAPGIDEPLARVDSTAATYYSVDGLGSVVLLSDGTGTVKNKYSYGPWGELLTASEQLVQPFAFTSREFTVLDLGVVEEAHYYSRMRYLFPRIGRFVSEDPIQDYIPVIGAAAYSYVGNSPTAFDDPFGLACRDRVSYGVKHVYSVVNYTSSWRPAFGATSGNDRGGIGPQPTAPMQRQPVPQGGLGWPVVVQECFWRRLRETTSFWWRNKRVITHCDCFPCVDDCVPQTYVSSEVERGSDRRSRREQTTTSGFMVVGLMHPCPRPDDY